MSAAAFHTPDDVIISARTDTITKTTHPNFLIVLSILNYISFRVFYFAVRLHALMHDAGRFVYVKNTPSLSIARSW